MKRRLLHLLFGAVAFIIILYVVHMLDYMRISIDFMRILYHYLPILIISVIALLAKQYYAGHIFLISSELGLIAEYIINTLHIKNMVRIHGEMGDVVSLYGNSINIMILAAGLVIGVIVQIVMNKRKKNAIKNNSVSNTSQ